MHVNIVFSDNGVGLSRDARIIKDALGRSGLRVTLTPIDGFHFNIGLKQLARVLRVRLIAGYHWLRYKRRPFDLTLFLEHIEPVYCRLGHTIGFMPNPEWANEIDVSHLHLIDHILAKVRDTQRIFEAQGCRVTYTGFTSIDRKLPISDAQRQRSFFHLAGKSRQKGTATLIELWQRHPEWPLLTIVQDPKLKSRMPDTQATPNICHIGKTLDDEELKVLQNTHLFHLCASEAEGFGHYIVEALSCGAVTVTTNAPPMNELVSTERGILVDHARTQAQHLGMNYYVSPEALEAAVNQLLGMSTQGTEALSIKARAWFEDNDRQFQQNIVSAVRQLLTKPASP